MRDVVARCEEGFAAQILVHEKQMDKMTLHVKSMQDDMKIMAETLSERDAQLLKLKLESDDLKEMLKKPKIVEASTQTTPAYTSSATQTPPMSNLTPAIVQAVQHISEAISTGLNAERNNDALSCPDQQVDISQAVSSVFQNVVASTILNKPRDVDVPKHTITQALQTAIQSSLDVTPDFIPIHEAVLFLQFANNYPITQTISIIEEEEEVPELINEYVVIEDEEEEDYNDDLISFWENKNLVCNSSDDSDIDSGDMETSDMETVVMETEQTKDDGYITYSRSINQLLPFFILFNRWILLCVSLYIIFYQTI